MKAPGCDSYLNCDYYTKFQNYYRGCLSEVGEKEYADGNQMYLDEMKKELTKIRENKEAELEKKAKEAAQKAVVVEKLIEAEAKEDNTQEERKSNAEEGFAKEEREGNTQEEGYAEVEVNTSGEIHKEDKEDIELNEVENDIINTKAKILEEKDKDKYIKDEIKALQEEHELLLEEYEELKKEVAETRAALERKRKDEEVSYARIDGY